MTALYLRYTPVALYELNRLADSEDLYAMARIHCAVVGDGLLGEDLESLLLDSPLIPADDEYEFYAQSSCEPPGALRIERVARPVDPQTRWNVEYVSTVTGVTYYCGLSNDGVEVASLSTRTPQMHYAPMVWWDGKPGSYATPR